MAKLKLSLHVITMNREDQMLRLLSATKGYYDTIRVCDGGSTDNTIAICEAFGCKVFRRPWDDDMSAQHNVLLDAAKKGEWISVYDDDEKPSRLLLSRTRTYAREGNLQGYQVVKIPSIMVIDGFADWAVLNLTAAILSGEQADRFAKLILFKNVDNIFYSGTAHYGLDWSILQHWTTRDIIPEPYFHYKRPIDQVRCNIQQAFINPDMQEVGSALGRTLRTEFAKRNIRDSRAMLDALDSGKIGDKLRSFFATWRDPQEGTISDFYRYYFLFKHPEKLEAFPEIVERIKEDPATRRFLKDLGGYKSRVVTCTSGDEVLSWLPIGHLDIHPALRELLGTEQVLWERRNRTPDDR